MCSHQWLAARAATMAGALARFGLSWHMSHSQSIVPTCLAADMWPLMFIFYQNTHPTCCMTSKPESLADLHCAQMIPSKSDHQWPCAKITRDFWPFQCPKKDRLSFCCLFWFFALFLCFFTVFCHRNQCHNTQTASGKQKQHKTCNWCPLQACGVHHSMDLNLTGVQRSLFMQWNKRGKI